jgi:uncharacterized protein (TIGR00369 family)
MSGIELDQLRDLVPFANTVGIELLDVDPDLVRGLLRWTAERCTVGGIMHGGALMALADHCGGICAFLNLPDGAQGTATIESKSNFLRGVSGGVVTATTRPLHKGRSVLVAETELTDDAGRLVAKVTQTQIFHYPRD